MRVQVYLHGQRPGECDPPHRCSSFLASLIHGKFPSLVDYDGRALRLLTRGTWKDLKGRACTAKSNAGIPSLLPPGPDGCMMLSYPPVPAGPNERRRQRDMWMRADRF